MFIFGSLTNKFADHWSKNLLNKPKHNEKPNMLWFFSDENNFDQDQKVSIQNNMWSCSNSIELSIPLLCTSNCYHLWRSLELWVIRVMWCLLTFSVNVPGSTQPSTSRHWKLLSIHELIKWLWGGRKSSIMTLFPLTVCKTQEWLAENFTITWLLIFDLLALLI